MIKSTSTIKQPATYSYPKLRVSTTFQGHVVLFSKPSVGTTVHPTIAYKMGYYSECWDDACFTDYHGDIILQNG